MDPAKVQIAKDQGLANVDAAVLAAVAAGLDKPTLLNWAACCALLEQESGGRNVFGHDSGQPFEGAGKVTRFKYRRYVKARDTEPGAPHCQGVGPAQLTSKGYQDQADALGGCWRPVFNMTVGFGILRHNRAAGKTWHDTWLAYNGAESYADQMDARYAKWVQLLNP